MSKGFDTKMVPQWVAEGIEAAFVEWEEMSRGEWLQTAPEYHLTVRVAQRLREAIPRTRRTLLMEPKVDQTLRDAGGVQRGRKAMKLRNGGRFDIVLGHADGRPRVLIELKNPIYDPRGDLVTKDLHRLCKALLHGRDHSQIHAGVFAFFTSFAPPKKRDATAKDRLQRKWISEWRGVLQNWEWDGRGALDYASQLRINVGAKVHEVHVDGEIHAWAAVCVQITRKSKE